MEVELENTKILKGKSKLMMVCFRMENLSNKGELNDLINSIFNVSYFLKKNPDK